MRTPIRLFATALALCALGGCSLFKSNAQNIANAAAMVSGPACAQIAVTLQPAENAQVCKDLTNCAYAFCTAVPTPVK